MSGITAEAKRKKTGEAREPTPVRGEPPRIPVYSERVTPFTVRETDDPNAKEVVMPREALERLGVEPGDTVYLAPTGGGTAIAGVSDIRERIEGIDRMFEEKDEVFAALAKV